jgi:hypothetical protein
VQHDPIKPKLKAPGTKRLEPKYVGPLSNFAFKFNLRLYSVVTNLDEARRTSHNAVLDVRRGPGAGPNPKP